MFYEILIICTLYTGVICPQVVDSNEFPTFFRKEHSLVHPYQGRGMQVANWDYTGSALITKDFVRLTPDRQGRRGSIWNIVPVSYRYWEVHLNIHLHGSGRTLFGDGVAFWYARDRSQEGDVFGSNDYFSGAGIFFDTFQNNVYSNQEFPYISASVFNGSQKYDTQLDGKDSMLAGCHCKMRGKETATFSISYIGNQLAVSYDLDGSEDWRLCFYLHDVLLPTGYYFGLTSATGDLADNHDIISVKTYEVDASNLNLDSSISPHDIIPSAKERASKPSFTVSDPILSPRVYKILIFLALFLLIVAIGGVASYLWYQKAQRSKKKHLF